MSLPSFREKADHVHQPDNPVVSATPTTTTASLDEPPWQQQQHPADSCLQQHQQHQQQEQQHVLLPSTSSLTVASPAIACSTCTGSNRDYRHHPNVETSGSPEAGPLVLLQLTLQGAAASPGSTLHPN